MNNNNIKLWKPHHLEQYTGKLKLTQWRNYFLYIKTVQNIGNIQWESGAGFVP